MTLVQRLAALGLAAMFVAAPALAEDKWGTLKGKFVYDAPTAPAPIAMAIPGVIPGCPLCKPAPVSEELIVDAKSLGIKNIVVYLIDEEVKIHPDYEKLKAEPAVMDNNNCTFKPHLLTMWTAQKLKITNTDKCAHNAAGTFKKQAAFNPLIQPNGNYKVDAMVSQTLPQPVTCAIHPWMKGYVLARATPYVTTTNADGEFEIKNIPVGEHEFQVWHEKSGYLVADPSWVSGRKKGIAKWKIDDGQTNDVGTIKVDPKLLK